MSVQSSPGRRTYVRKVWGELSQGKPHKEIRPCVASKRGSGWQAHPASCARKPLRREPLLPSSPASTQMRASSFQRRRAGIQFSVHRLVHSLRVGSWISASKQDLRLADPWLSSRPPLRAEPCRCYSLGSNCLSSSEDLCPAVSSFSALVFQLADLSARAGARSNE